MIPTERAAKIDLIQRGLLPNLEDVIAQARRELNKAITRKVVWETRLRELHQER